MSHRTLSASDAATYVQLKRPDAERGVMLVRCVSSGSAVACIFGNDNFGIDRTRREVQLLRDYLRRVDLHEGDIGLSRDGRSWAVLVEVDVPSFKTELGRAFHMEMMRSCLEDMIQRAWQEADVANPATSALG